MSGKSTFIRAVAINAICAQSFHTTFGTWRATPLRVHAAMETATGESTDVVQVAEVFNGTNPSLRVPIVVAVLDYLAEHDFVLVATHDLEVAARTTARLSRGYFGEPERAADCDYKLRPGVAAAGNSPALLVRANYPPSIIAAIEDSSHTKLS